MTLEDVMTLIEEKKVFIASITFKKGAIAYKKGTMFQFNFEDIDKFEVSDSSDNLVYKMKMAD